MEQQPQISGRRNRSHDWIDQRSLALDREIAEMLRQNPGLLEKAKCNLNRRIQQREPEVLVVMHEWRDILCNWPLEKILALLTAFDEDARRLRQSSPFCGILTPERRLAIFQEYEAART